MSFVLIHGAGFGANCWDELIPHLNTEALAVDLPGRGTRPRTAHDHSRGLRRCGP